MNKRKTIHPGEVCRALARVDLFESLSEEDLIRFVKAGKVRDYKRGTMLFRRGDAADRIHLILDGAIEIVRPTPDHAEPVPVAYLSPGELIGDMALFTGTQRRSGGRIPETARIWTLTRKSFHRIAEGISGHGIELAHVFARRLEDFISRMRRQSRRMELAGHLRHFDMPTVVQTLVSSSQTGVLTVTDGAGENYAEVLLIDGAISRARCGVREGEEAFFEMFLAGENAEFVFHALPEPDADAVSKVAIAVPAMGLLMEAMRLVDELAAFRERLPEPERTLHKNTEELDWTDDKTEPLAQNVFALLEKPQSMAEVGEHVDCTTFALYEVVANLYESKQIA